MKNRSLRPYLLTGTMTAACLIVASVAGLLVQDLYTPFLKSDALRVGLAIQDFVSLLVAPLLLVTMCLTSRGSLRAFIIWAGLLVYVAYYYAFFVFGYVYTVFYPLYLVLVGLSFFSFIGLLVGLDLDAFRQQVSDRMPVRFISAVLGMPVFLAPLWLAMIVRGINSQQAAEVDLVFVLDLTLLIPAMLLAAVQIWRRRPFGYWLGGVLLVKAALSGILLTAGSLWSLWLGFAVGPDLAIYVFLAVAGLWALLLYLRNVQQAERHQLELRVRATM